MENYIKEAKAGFYFDKTDSPRFLENQVRMMISVLAYNLVNFLKTIGFEKVNQSMTIHSIRLRLLKVAGKLVQTGRRVYRNLSRVIMCTKLDFIRFSSACGVPNNEFTAQLNQLIFFQSNKLSGISILRQQRWTFI